jgi:hypothetical protein
LLSDEEGVLVGAEGAGVEAGLAPSPLAPSPLLEEELESLELVEDAEDVAGGSFLLLL